MDREDWEYLTAAMLIVAGVFLSVVDFVYQVVGVR